MEGYLKKKSKRGMWQKRYFVIEARRVDGADGNVHTPHLCYYKTGAYILRDTCVDRSCVTYHLR